MLEGGRRRCVRLARASGSPLGVYPTDFPNTFPFGLITETANILHVVGHSTLSFQNFSFTNE